MLKKKENSLYNVTGKKLTGVYFALETAFGGKRAVCEVPTDTVLDDAGSCSSAWTSTLSGSICEPAEAERKLGSRRCDPNLLKVSMLGLRRWPFAASNGAPSSPPLELPVGNRFVPSTPGSSINNHLKSSWLVSLSRPRSP